MSVCPSQLGVLPRWLKQTTPYDSRTLDSRFLIPKISRNFQLGHPHLSRQIEVEYVKIGNLWPISWYISYALYQMSLFPVTLSDPQLPQSTLPPFSIFCIVFHVFMWRMEIETSNLVSRLIIASSCPRMTCHPWYGRVVSSREPFNFWGNQWYL